MHPTEKQIAVRRELLSYLANYPQRIKDGTVTLGDLCLDLGKALTWCQAELDGHVPQTSEPLGQAPQSIGALGKQFQTVGLLALDREIPLTQGCLADAENITARMQILCKRIAHRTGGAQ